MYKAYYGFQGEPFSKSIDSNKIYFHKNIKELDSRLNYIKKHKGIMLITGDPGTGKTTSIRHFVNTLNSDIFIPLYIPLATVAINDFYKQINSSLLGESLQSKSQIFKSIQERILHYAKHQNKIPVIIIDEAHLLKNENFFELQIITNFNIDSYDPALFILLGQSHLNDRLSRSILDSFNQRISMKFNFLPLNLKETKGYISHHFNIFGVNPSVLSENAIKTIFNLTGGIIRRIGHLTIKTLTLGAQLKKQTITEEEVLIASKEL